MPRDRTVPEKVGDASQAFWALREELTPAPLRAMMTELTASVPPDGAGDIDQVNAYIQRVNAAASIARLVFANDRAAMIGAVMLTQSGVSRPVLDVIDGGEA